MEPFTFKEGSTVVTVEPEVLLTRLAQKDLAIAVLEQRVREQAAQLKALQGDNTTQAQNAQPETPANVPKKATTG